jgi:hypothetical protein
MVNNLDEKYTDVEVLAIVSDDEMDIPIDVAFDVVNATLGTALKAKGYPVDKTNDADPNPKVIMNKLKDSTPL